MRWDETFQMTIFFINLIDYTFIEFSESPKESKECWNEMIYLRLRELIDF